VCVCVCVCVCDKYVFSCLERWCINYVQQPTTRFMAIKQVDLC